MANGHVEIHDPFDNNNMASSNTDPTSQTASMDDTVEFKLLMVYAQRRRPSRAAELDSPRQTDPLLTQTAENDKEAKEEDGKKKKKMMRKKKSGGGKGMWRMFSCIKPSTKCDEPSEPTLGAPKPALGAPEPALGAPEPALGAPEPEFRCGVLRTDSNDVERRDELDEVAGILTEIASEIPFTPPEIEEDTSDDVEKVVALLLREAGDKLDQEIKDVNIAAEVFRNYSFFEKVMETLLRKMGLMSEPDHLGPQASPKTQIAVTCEATSRLLTLTSFPQRSMLGYGAQYLQQYFSGWVEENGGYVEAFHSNDEEEVE